MRTYHRLTVGQRNQIYALMKAGLSQRAIAVQIGVHKSTMDRKTPYLRARRVSLAKKPSTAFSGVVVVFL